MSSPKALAEDDDQPFARRKPEASGEGHLLVHRSPHKAAFYRSGPSLNWSDELGAWMTADREIILSVLRDRRFEAIDFEREARRLEERIGIDLSATRSVVAALPIGNEGKRHTETRRKAALFVKQSSPAANAAFRESLANRLGRAIEAGGKFELVAEVLSPSVDRLFEVLTGVQPGKAAGDVPLPLVFDRMQSINRRKRIEQKLRSISGSHETGCPVAAGDPTLATALTVVGSDSLLASLAESFIFEVRRNQGHRLCEIAWNERLPRTGVPYVDRIVGEDLEFGECRLEAGQRVRLFLDAFGMFEAADNDFYFGGGRHVCLGKAVSIEAWHAMTSILAGFDAHLTIDDVQYRKSDFLFNAPESVKVGIRHD